jgi:hypothetical protein
MNKVSRSITLCVLMLLVASVALGQTTSSLSGTVTTEGTGLPGVTVTISSPRMQGTRSTVTGEAGGYSFGAIPPGDYSVRFELSGLATVTRTVQIGVGQSGSVDANMSVSAVAESITVTAAAPSVLETPGATSNISGEMIEELPIPRTVLATAALAPGVNTSTVSAGQLQISGSPGYDNVVMVNGVKITETIRNQAQPLFIEDAVQETTVMTAGVSAEYGGFTGGVVNTITKSGGNEFSGSFRDSLTNPRWTEPTPTQVGENSDTLNEVYEATLGGFILRDRLWFFGAGRDTESSGLPQATRPVPGADATTFSLTSVTTERRLEGKLTAAITPKHNLALSYFDLASQSTNQRFTATSYDLEQFSDREDPRKLQSAFYNGVITDTLMLEARYSKMEYGIGWGSGAKFRDFQRGTIVRNLADGAARWNSATFCGVCDKETRNNDGMGVKGSYFLSSKSLGNHSFVAGWDSNSEHRYANNYQSGSDFRFFVNGATRVGENIYPLVRPGTAVVPGSAASPAYLVWTPIFALQGAESDLQTDSFFINDRWELNNHLSFSIGARYDRNNAIDSTGNTVSDDSKISPRLNVVYDLAGNGRHRVSASYGEYVSRIVEGAATSQSSGGSPAYIYFPYNGPAINVTNPTEFNTREALAIVENWFYSQCDAAGKCGPENLALVAQGLGHSVPGYSARVNGQLSSPYVREITLGYGVQIASNALARVDLVSRNWSDFYGIRVDPSTPRENDFLGLPHDIQIIENTNDIEREYRGIQFQTTWRPRRFNVGLNYTWSTLKGNDEQESATSGTVGNSPGTSYYPELLTYDRRQPLGYIADQDQRHRARAWAGYDIPMPNILGQLNVSVLQNFDSGTPYSMVGNINLRPYRDALTAGIGYKTVPASGQYFFSDRGEFRRDDVSSTDLALNYRYPIGRFELFAQGELINMFNRATVLVVNQTVTVLSNTFNPFTQTPIMCAPSPAGGPIKSNPACVAEGAHYRLSETTGPTGGFGEAASSTSANYQQMRTYRVSVGARF